MQLYRFSPINDEGTFEKALEYIVSEMDKLSQEFFNDTLPITTLKIFAHYPEEYEYLHSMVSSLGPTAPFSSQTSLYVEVEREILGYAITYIGIRIVDPYRLHVGCGDWEIAGFETFKKEQLGKTPFVREFNDEMIEVWYPDTDVLGYAVPPL